MRGEIKMTLNEIDKSNVKYFGTEVDRINDKKGKFKSFHTRNWIKMVDGDRIYIEDGITALKQSFPNFSSNKFIIQEEKNGKIKKATRWDCEVVEEGSNFFHKDHAPLIKEAIKNHAPFTLDSHHLFYYIADNVFRDTKNDQLVYVDLDHMRLINIQLEKPNMKNLEKWIKENIDTD